MKRILCCLDDSPIAARVHHTAHLVAHATGGRVTQLRVLGLLHDGEARPGILDMTPAALLGERENHARAELDALAALEPAAARGPIVIRVGVPWDAICREARELDVDLIVLGAHRYHGVDRILGTTSAKVVDHADRSVLVVR